MKLLLFLLLSIPVFAQDSCEVQLGKCERNSMRYVKAISLYRDLSDQKDITISDLKKVVIQKDVIINSCKDESDNSGRKIKLLKIERAGLVVIGLLLTGKLIL